MNADETKQRQQGAEMIIARCKELARELGVDLKEVKWKEDTEDARDVYTLVVEIGPTPDQIPLDSTELQAYASKTNAQGTDEKLKSLIQKRPSGY
jgi:hypothetical protein